MRNSALIHPLHLELETALPLNDRADARKKSARPLPTRCGGKNEEIGDGNSRMDLRGSYWSGCLLCGAWLAGPGPDRRFGRCKESDTAVCGPERYWTWLNGEQRKLLLVPFGKRFVRHSYPPIVLCPLAGEQSRHTYQLVLSPTHARYPAFPQ